MTGLERLEQLRRDKRVGYFACGNARGVGDERAAFCTIWGYPTSIMLASEEAPTVTEAIDAALAVLDAPAPVTMPAPTAPVMRMPG